MNDVLRILDANLNRAREGLRTAEEYARFMLEDAPAQAALKAVRRGLEAFQRLPGMQPPALLSARDVTGDVGVRPKADDVERRDARDIARAGLLRAQEALRVLEEYGGLVSREAAACAATARYELYGAEQQLFAAGERRAVLRAARVMVVFSRALCARPWREALIELIEAGARCFQLREKEASARDLLAFAAEFLAQAHPAEALVLVNDRADIAQACQADGVHLGQEDLPIASARSLLSSAALVGLSTHNLQEAQAAQQAGADYIGLGAMFPTDTKPVVHRRGREVLPDVAAGISIPVFAIGGVSGDNVAELARLGARRVAVSGAILRAQEPAAEWRRIHEALAETASKEST